MTDHEAKQRAYQAKRLKVGPAVPLEDFRIVLPNGSEKHERAAGLPQIAAAYPEAVMIARMDFAGFW